MAKTAEDASKLMGFAGLAGLVSDISEPIPQAQAEASPPPPAESNPAPGQAAVNRADSPKARPIGKPPATPVPSPASPSPALSLSLEAVEETPETGISNAKVGKPTGLPKAAPPSPSASPQALSLSLEAAEETMEPLATAAKTGARAHTAPRKTEAPKTASPKPPPSSRSPQAAGTKSRATDSGAKPAVPVGLVAGLVALLLAGSVFLARDREPLGGLLSSMGGAGNASSYPNEEKPPAGPNHMLNNGQLRYCLSEKARVTEIENLLDQHSQPEIDAYNRWVADFNARCASFRYDLNTIDSIKRRVEQEQTALKVQAKRRLAELRARNAENQPAQPQTSD